MNDALQIAVAVLAITAALTGAVAVAVRFMLVPYLRTELVEPVAQINHQVTVNGGSSEQPTILDKLHDVQMEVRAVKVDVYEAKMEAREAKMESQVVTRMFDGHLTWSQDAVDVMTDRIAAVEKQQEKG